MLAFHVLDGLPVRWRARIKDWCGLKNCFDCSVRVLYAYGIPYICISAMMALEQRAEFWKNCNYLPAGDYPSYQYNDVPVVQLAVSSTLPYLELVHKAHEIPSLSEHERNLARRYAYFLFFQRRIPINMAVEQKGYSPLDPAKIRLLFPGNDAVMDMICDRIMNGGEFML